MTTTDDYHRQVRELRAELHAIKGGSMAATPTPPTGPEGQTPRMTLSRVVELLLTRGSGDRSSVTLSRNARGETQIEVTVRTADDVPTVLDCERVAVAVYERLRSAYPMSSGYVGAKGGDNQ